MKKRVMHMYAYIFRMLNIHLECCWNKNESDVGAYAYVCISMSLLPIP